MVVKIGKVSIQPLDMAMMLVSTVWLSFQIFVDVGSRPSTINEAFLLILGAWLTNKTIEQKRAERTTDARLTAVEDVAKTANPKLSAEKGVGQGDDD